MTTALKRYRATAAGAELELERRTFRLLQEPGELRTATHAPGDPDDQREHLIVPVIMLVEGVIHPVNAATPELVLAEELAPTVGAWNGEPVCWNHPDIAGTRVSANTPEVLERFMVGRLFNVRLDGKKLKGEAWLDVRRCEAMGGQALELLERVRAGEMIEVSVGAFVAAEKLEGVHDGKRFAAVWREIGPDHLAMLPAGVEGACSIGMGCGAPRAAAAGEVELTTCVVPQNVSTEIGPADRSWSRLRLSDFTDQQWDDLSDSEKRRIAGHFAYADASPASSFGELKLGHHFPDTGAVSPRGVSAALGRVDQTDISQEARDAARSHLEAHRDAIEARNAAGAPSAEGLLHVLSADGLLLATESTEEGPVTMGGTEGGLGRFRTLVEQMKGLGRYLLRDAQGDLSDNDVREILSSALFATEPAFVGIEAVFPETSEVVYLVAPDAELQWFSRSFEISEDREVTFGEAVEVVPTTTFEPVTAASCGCTDQAACECAGQTAEGIDMDKAQRVAALIAAENTEYTEDDREGLMALSDATLTALEAAATEEPEGDEGDAGDQAAAGEPNGDDAGDGEEDEEGAEEPTEASGKPKQMTAEEWFAMAPPEIREPLQRELARAAAAKAQLVDKLATAQGVYDKTELEAMDLTELEKVQKLCAGGGEDADADDTPAVDFSGLGLPRASSAKPTGTVDPPPSLRTAVSERAN